MNYEIEFLKSLGLTILVETITLFVLTKLIIKNPDVKIWIILLAGIIASFATLPYLWFILPLFIKTKIFYIIISESSAVIIETFILSGFLKTNLKKAFVFSFFCNLTSYLIGLLIRI
ncbi:MAG: hypothetical protein JXB17_08955 [Bacteroidales bacterium]|nr:hypothetical protein [Bacteroidales bacterium]